MQKLWRKLIVTLSASLLTSLVLMPTYSQPASYQPSFKVLRNVSYVATSDRVRVGDVFLPVDRKQHRPIIIYVHGGGWEGGSKEEDEPIVENIVDAGFVVFNINYRLLRQGGEFPGDINDLKDALAFCASNSAAWGADPGRIGAMGTSAGAHLALMMAYAPDSVIGAPHYRDSRARIGAVVSWFGPTDLDDMHGDLLDRYLVNAPGGYKKASPINYVHSAVPTLLVHGTNDDLVPYSQSTKLLTALRSAHVVAEMHTVNGEGHGFTKGFPAAMAKTIHFFSSHL